MHGDFTWVDLSTFDLREAQSFYSAILGWEFVDDGSGYCNCRVSGSPSAEIFEMPEAFRKINMPFFWMTYIPVDNVSAAVATARQFGGKIELEQADS